MVEQVNSAVLKAADDDPLKAEEHRAHIIRWNAKRAMLDGLQAYINETCAERDRLLKEQQQEETYKQYVYSTSHTGI